MFPFIKDGQEVALRRKSQYSPGDIVLAITYPERETVMHYVVKDCGDCLLLMGAANLVKYERCRKDDVTGYLHSPHVSRNRIMLWHRLLPLRRYLLWIMRIGIRRE